MNRRVAASILTVAVFLSVLAANGQVAHSQNFPMRPVWITSPYGSGPDVMARLIGEELSKLWKQSVVVEPKPGGDGIVAITTVKSKPKDGHDLLFLGNGHLTINPNLRCTLREPVFGTRESLSASKDGYNLRQA